MNSRIIKLQKKDRIAVIEFDNEMFKEDRLIQLSYDFSDLCSDISSDSEIRVLVISIKGENDGSEEGRGSGYPDPDVPSISESVTGLDIPVIIGIDGHILGLCLELALACDIRIATTQSFLGFPGIIQGIIPSAGGTQRLPRIVGKGKALEMILTGCLIDADTGLGIGLVNRTVSRDKLNSLLMELASEMSEKSPVSMMYTKEAINKGMDMTLEQGIRLEADLYFLMHTTNDRTEGIKAFQEKRKPDFRGD